MTAAHLHWSMNDLRVSVGPCSLGRPWSLDVDVMRPSTGEVESMMWQANAPHGLARRDGLSGDPNTTARVGGGHELLIHADQGVGDIVQQWRYVRPAAAQFCRASVLCRPELQRLLRLQSSEIEVRTFYKGHNDSDIVPVPLMRLGSLSHDETGGTPYLIAPRHEPATAGGRLRVGLNWGTSKAGAASRVRSLPPRFLERILRDYPEIDWVSVQWGAEERWLSEQPWAVDVEPLGREFNDVADLAGAIAGLDLLISSDSAPAHIAGALGVPVWTLLSRPCSWRWGLLNSTTPLYRGMRLIRQTRQGDWTGVMAQVHRMLGGILGLPDTANLLFARPWQDPSIELLGEAGAPITGIQEDTVMRAASLDEALSLCREKDDWRAAFVFRPLALLATLGVQPWSWDYAGLSKVFKTMVDCHGGFSWCTPLHD